MNLEEFDSLDVGIKTIRGIGMVITGLTFSQHCEIAELARERLKQLDYESFDPQI